MEQWVDSNTLAWVDSDAQWLGNDNDVSAAVLRIPLQTMEHSVFAQSVVQHDPVPPVEIAGKNHVVVVDVSIPASLTGNIGTRLNGISFHIDSNIHPGVLSVPISVRAVTLDINTIHRAPTLSLGMEVLPFMYAGTRLLEFALLESGVQTRAHLSSGVAREIRLKTSVNTGTTLETTVDGHGVAEEAYNA
jgi:hypothetical protein